ncbi:hypothetical protein HYPSUDRAFT_67629 [Hypholoma sublateritium FD-334 SS-4]|uniref:F-box domain-containing protein n=1 Tax=Hypholoma sublateritium (strain FD-334 SS-4) TaxID=945553 RepID=A0A0D2L4J0_HYPSF|nr:hypothetical protein HYPSUDRAFT_67629 [Hypholoma sublateritium FD-334 SS-4]
MKNSGFILPYDIMKSIADQIALEVQVGERTDARPTLQALSLTCKHMVPVCRRHLFSSIQLSSYSSNPNCKKLLILLRENLEIASYVRKLTYCVKMLADEHEDGVLEVLLRHSTFLHSISLLANANSPDAWNAQPEPTKTLLISLIQLRTITHLHFRSFHGFFPYNQLSFCSGLRSLELQYMAPLLLGDISPVNVTASPQIPALQSLINNDAPYHALGILMDATKGPNALGPIIDFSCLQKADLTIHSRAQADRIGELRLFETAKQLQELIIRVSPSHTVSLAGLGSSLAANTPPTLRSIVLHSEVDYMTVNPLRGLDHALQDMAGRNALVELEVLIKVESSDGCYTYSDDFPNLDKILSKNSAFPELRRVSLDVVWDSYVGQYSAGPTDLGPPGQLEREDFPLLDSSSIINFSCGEKDD